MAELVDAHVSGACIERCAGSSPVPGTKKKEDRMAFFSFLYLSRTASHYRMHLAAAIAEEEEEAVGNDKEEGDDKGVEVFVGHHDITDIDD